MAWASFWYQYLVGGLIFLVGMIYTVRQGVVGFSSREKRHNLFVLLGGMLLVFSMHLALMLLGSGE